MDRRFLPLTLTAPTGRQLFLRWTLVVACALTLLGTGIHYSFKAAEDRSAFVRWRPLIHRLIRGEDVYLAGQYPNPPLMGIVLYPLAVLPPVVGAMAWYGLKVLMAGAGLRWALLLARSPGGQASFGVTAVVVLLSMRPLIGDLQHGNVNILICFLVIGGLWAFRRGCDWLTGLAIALGTTFKVTPALLIPYFAYKRQWKVVSWSLTGLLLFLLLPSVVLGPRRNCELLRSWTRVMIKPYLVRGDVETLQINQSLPGVFYRLFTDSPGIEFKDDTLLSVNWCSLDPRVARLILRGMILCLLAWLCWVSRRASEDRCDWRWACEFGLVLIAMLFISERSWKHHYVTMILPYAVLVRHVAERSRPGVLRNYLVGTLVASFLLMASTSPELGGLLVGGRGHKYAEAYGMFFLAGLLVFVALSVLLIRPRAQAAASRTTGSAFSSAWSSAGTAGT